MNWLRKHSPKHRTRRRPTARERAAAARTARAEADLRATEAEIHELAERTRREIRRS